MKTFRGEIEKFRLKLERHEPFALARYGDGELGIIKNELIEDWGEMKFQEFKHYPEDEAYLLMRQRLLDSLCYRHEQYYVGLECPRCSKEGDLELMRRLSRQDDEHLTFAYLFANTNYSFYKRHILPLYSQYDVILVCNREATIERLPFPVKKHFAIGMNAGIEDYEVIETVKQYITEEQIKGALFLFCAGPFACVLAHRLHSFCEENTYIDIGTTLDVQLFDFATRSYLRAAPDPKDEHACVWTQQAQERRAH
jgi:hypothetical protein